MPPDNQIYNVIISIEVLQYVSNKDAFYDKVNKLLSDNGIFIFTEVNKISWRTILHNIKKSRDFYRYQKSTELLSILRKRFKIIDIYGFMWQPCGLLSDSVMIDFFKYIEKIVLNKFFIQSPWWLIACRKKREY